jgi:hypothetical protein
LFGCFTIRLAGRLVLQIARQLSMCWRSATPEVRLNKTNTWGRSAIFAETGSEELAIKAKAQSQIIKTDELIKRDLLVAEAQVKIRRAQLYILQAA